MRRYGRCRCHPGRPEGPSRDPSCLVPKDWALASLGRDDRLPKDFSLKTKASLFRRAAAKCQSPLLAKLSRRARRLQKRNRQYVRLIYAVRTTSENGSATKHECDKWIGPCFIRF